MKMNLIFDSVFREKRRTELTTYSSRYDGDKYGYVG